MRENKIPSWAAELERDLEKMAEELTDSLTGFQDHGSQISPEDCGYCGQENAAYWIQKAIDRVHAEGGGTVLLAGGDYISGTIVLKSNVALKLDKGSRLLGSLDLADYPEHIARRITVQDTNMGMNQSLIFAEGEENISICGEGIIDGRGTADHFSGTETQGGTPGRPFLIRVLDCKGVTIRDISLKDAACWMENYLNCEELLIDSVKIENQANYNNDGIDIDSCRNVIVRGCIISSGDDSICFKGAGQAETNRVLVENCTCYTSCNAIKIGTDTQGDFRNFLVRNCRIGGVEENMRRIKVTGADSGITWDMVDGGTVENLMVKNVEISLARSPFYLRMDKRGRVKPQDPKPGIGRLRRIVFAHISGKDNGPRGSYFLGIPERSIEDVVLYDIHLGQKASRLPVSSEETYGEMYGIYPDAHMLGDVSELADAPAWGLWAKYVKGLTLSDYEIIPDGEEKRPQYLFDTEIRLTEA